MKRIPCSKGCGRYVLVKYGVVCRKCRKRSRIRLGRIEYKKRRDAAKSK